MEKLAKGETITGTTEIGVHSCCLVGILKIPTLPKRSTINFGFLKTSTVLFGC